MLKINRSCVDTRTCSTQRQDTRKRGRKTRNLHLNEAYSRLNDLIEDGLSEESASKLTSSIVSLVSFDGEKIYSQSTGIVVENDQFSASFLTSKDLIRKKSAFVPGLQIKVYLPNREVVNGLVQYYSAKWRMVVVTTKPSPHLVTACLGNIMQAESSSGLFAITCCYKTGNLLVTTGTLASSPSGLEGIMQSTCQISVDGSGGPLVSPDGNIVGMNLCTEESTTPFIPTDQIYDCLRKLAIRTRHMLLAATNVSACTSHFAPHAALQAKTYLENFTPLSSSSEGISSLDTIIGSSSEGSENKNQDANVEWCDLSQELASKLSPSIVSLASFDGETLHSECTGMVIDSESCSASFLTTGSLFGSLDPELWSKVVIKVRLPNDEVVHGWLDYYMSKNNIAVVTTDSLLVPYFHLRVACLDNNVRVESAAGVLAVRRYFDSGKLVYTGGSLTGGIQNKELNSSLTGGIQNKELNFSTCKINEVASGGPLVDRDGNIVGMNYYGGETTPFLPSNLIVEQLGPEIYRASSKQDHCCTNEIQESSTPCSNDPKELTDNELECILAPWIASPGKFDEFEVRANEMLRTAGYPLPKFADDGMYLKGTFDDEFGRENWSERTRRVASKMSRSVVALASFIVESDSAEELKKRRKHFACSGVFIECDGSTTSVLTSASLVRTSGEESNIHPKLEIEVCLPSKRRVVGTLQHCDLHYNVAVVSIMGVCSHRAAKLDEVSQTEVVALGRGFMSGMLMATNGAVTGKCSKFDCKELWVSTCKISKAGIGGPLVDFDGNFVGMNFYDMEKTPYITRDIILRLMKRFDAERTIDDADVVRTADKSKILSWPVPEAYWVYPSRYPPEPPCLAGEVDE
ncbi:hypothetical protein VPH35_111059 [Triticum aestivum]